MFRILIVEDDQKLNKLFSTVLNRSGYQTFSAFDGVQALSLLDTEYVDLIISDIMMPGIDGYELTQSLRESNYSVPILMITAKDTFEDKEKGFLSGTDDYMVKPVNVNEMVLRVKALLRRAKIMSDRKIVLGETTLEYDSLSIINNEQETFLPLKEFYLLYKLLSFPGKIFTRQQLMDEIWGMDTETEERTVDVHINRIRERFKNNSDFEITTVRGLGYKAVKKK